MLLMFSFLVVACTTPAEKSIKELEEIVVRVKADNRFYTEKDYEAIFAELEALTEKYADVRYTVEQQQRIEELNAELSSLLTEKFMEQVGGVFGGFMKGFANAFSGALIDGMAGVVDGMNEVVDGMNEIVEGLQDMVDDMNEVDDDI